MITTATVRALRADDFGFVVELHLATGDQQLAEQTAAGLAEITPLISALADGKTDPGEMFLVAGQLPITRMLAGMLGVSL